MSEKINANAWYDLALVYFCGTGVEKDPDKARQLLKIAVDNGSTDAQKLSNSISGVSEEGLAVEIVKLTGHDPEGGLVLPDAELDGDSAYREKLLLAAGGDAEAAAELALMYKEGRKPVVQNIRVSQNWLRRAAEQGYALAQFNLGKIYYYGEGVEEDYQKAVEWFAKAAEQDRADAQFFLGRCYGKGHGVEKDLNAAFGWYSKSAEKGDDAAICALGWAYQLGEGVDQDLAKAVEWLGKGAEKDDGVCMNNLARLYEDGKGVDQDIAKALELFTKASLHGCDRAFYHLGRFYENGLGTEVDLQKAKECYGKAADKGDKDAKAALERLNACD